MRGCRSESKSWIKTGLTAEENAEGIEKAFGESVCVLYPLLCGSVVEAIKFCSRQLVSSFSMHMNAALSVIK